MQFEGSFHHGMNEEEANQLVIDSNMQKIALQGEAPRLLFTQDSSIAQQPGIVKAKPPDNGLPMNAGLVESIDTNFLPLLPVQSVKTGSQYPKLY